VSVADDGTIRCWGLNDECDPPEIVGVPMGQLSCCET
jgi:hypothetical protein